MRSAPRVRYLLLTTRSIFTAIRMGSILAIPSLCLGLCLIAVCLLVPQSEANRRLAVDRDQLAQDLAQADAQLAVNAKFLDEAPGDPEVAERLAQRQMRQIRGGTAALHLDGEPATLTPVATITDMLRVPAPPPVAAYAPAEGSLNDLTATTRRQLFGLGGGLFLVAVGLVMGTAETVPTPAGTGQSQSEAGAARA
jgi:hypothetical protein